MEQQIYNHDAVHWYMSELTARIVAQSGIPSDIYHLGKIILQGLRDDPQFILQIDGGTGITETSGSVLERTIRCAIGLRNLGLKRGDVIILMAPTHLDLAIPFYAGFCLGLIIAPIDRTLGLYELQSTFEINRPKAVFCQSEKHAVVKRALDSLKMDAKIITFDKDPEAINFSDMLNDCGEDIKDFKATDFDPDKTTALLISSSGTTGPPKSAAHTQKTVAIVAPYLLSTFTQFPSPTRSMLTLAPLQWLSTILSFLLSPILRVTRVMSSLPVTPDHTYELINQYRPSFMAISPTMLTTLLKPGERDKCDFTCLEIMLVGGSAVHNSVLTDFKKISPKTLITDAYGMTETAITVFQEAFGKHGSCGTQRACFQYKLVNINTQEEILEPNVSGELWLKGPSIFKGYYNNPEATAEAFSEDGWFKTGDMFHRDENWNYYFVERIKMLLRYRNHQFTVTTQMSPVELESVIMKHPGVLDVAVTGIPHQEFGDLPVACVIRREGASVTAQEIKDLVKNTLTDTKQLRGGVVFVKELPLTPSTKIDRRKLKEIVLGMERE